MHTRGLAAETMDGLYEGERLAHALQDARRRTLAIYSHLDLEALAVPCIPIVNLPLWELAHVAWFQEYWCLRGGGDRGPSLLAGSDAMFNSSTVAHDTRWTLAYPPAARLLAYLRDSLDATLAALSRTSEDDRYFFKLAVLHEDMHGEALLMTLQTLELPTPPREALDPPEAGARAVRDIRFEGGEFVQGRGHGDFVFDNERSPHRVKVAPFAISSRPVTQGEFAAYVEASGTAPPRYWQRDGGTWLARRFERWHPIAADAPMVHVSLVEAKAYCDWAGRRLPTESEWEFAACEGADRFAWGRVWEWTSTPFAPYPGFEPGPYRDYSLPWFHDHYVLRGASAATHSRIANPRYRNFYLPHRGDTFAGFRTCASEGSGPV